MARDKRPPEDVPSGGINLDLQDMIKIRDLVEERGEYNEFFNKIKDDPQAMLDYFNSIHEMVEKAAERGEFDTER